MAQIPLLSGIGATENADFTLRYPVNLELVPVYSGVSKVNLRSASGVVPQSTGPGIDRGAIVWQGVHYRVMGTKLVSVSAGGDVTVLGDVGGSGPATLDYGPERLQIRSGTNLFFWSAGGGGLTQVTDVDLGQCIDQCWMDGFCVSTDGTYVVVNDLANPTAVNPLKYGSAESDPDPITGLLHDLRGELIVFGANSIQPFTNQGGSLFPFAPNISGVIPIGCVGPMAKCHFLESYAWVGGSRNSATGVWIGLTGQPKKISTRAIDDMLADVADQSAIQVEQRDARDEARLLVHLPDRTLVYLTNASLRNGGEPVWHVANSGQGMDKPYRPRNAVLAHGEWWVGDTETAALGTLSDGLATHFGEAVGWRFETALIYNQTNGGIIHGLELVGLPGRGPDADASFFVSYTNDGETWSPERANRLPAKGRRTERVAFNPHRRFRNYVGIAFRGDSNSLAGWAALEAQIEGLSA
jgi:hypothetical protein